MSRHECTLGDRGGGLEIALVRVLALDRENRPRGRAEPPAVRSGTEFFL